MWTPRADPVSNRQTLKVKVEVLLIATPRTPAIRWRNRCRENFQGMFGNAVVRITLLSAEEVAVGEALSTLVVEEVVPAATAVVVAVVVIVLAGVLVIAVVVSTLVTLARTAPKLPQVANTIGSENTFRN
jgi:hypothetical protein